MSQFIEKDTHVASSSDFIDFSLFFNVISSYVKVESRKQIQINCRIACSSVQKLSSFILYRTRQRFIDGYAEEEEKLAKLNEFQLFWKEREVRDEVKWQFKVTFPTHWHFSSLLSFVIHVCCSNSSLLPSCDVVRHKNQTINIASMIIWNVQCLQARQRLWLSRCVISIGPNWRWNCKFDIITDTFFLSLWDFDRCCLLQGAVTNYFWTLKDIFFQVEQKVPFTWVNIQIVRWQDRSKWDFQPYLIKISFFSMVNQLTELCTNKWVETNLHRP